MSKYVILGCDHNMNDCIESWTISLTEYGHGIFTGDSPVVLKSGPVAEPVESGRRTPNQ